MMSDLATIYDFFMPRVKNMTKTAIMLNWYHRQTDFYLHKEIDQPFDFLSQSLVYNIFKLLLK